MDPLMVLLSILIHTLPKLLPHFVQLNGFSPMQLPSWIFTWCGKAPVTFGALQWLFPSWILWYYFKSLWEALATLYALEWLLSSVIPFMSRHLMWKSFLVCNGFFPSWTLWWYFKYFDPEKLLPHFVQLNGFSPVWFPSWIFTCIRWQHKMHHC